MIKAIKTENCYHSVIYKINNEFSNPVQEELNA